MLSVIVPLSVVVVPMEEEGDDFLVTPNGKRYAPVITNSAGGLSNILVTVIACISLILTLVLFVIVLFLLREVRELLRLTNINSDTLTCGQNETLLHPIRLATGQILGGTCSPELNISLPNINPGALVCPPGDIAATTTVLGTGLVLDPFCITSTNTTVNNGSLTCPGQELAVTHTITAGGLSIDPFCLLPVTLNTFINTTDLVGNLGNLSIRPTGVTPGTYGGNGTFVQVTINAGGQITNATQFAGGFTGNGSLLLGTTDEVIITPGGGGLIFSTPQPTANTSTVQFAKARIGTCTGVPLFGPDTGIIISGDPASINQSNMPQLTFRMCPGAASIPTMDILSYDYNNSIIGMAGYFDPAVGGGQWICSTQGPISFMASLEGTTRFYSGQCPNALATAGVFQEQLDLDGTNGVATFAVGAKFPTPTGVPGIFDFYEKPFKISGTSSGATTGIAFNITFQRIGESVIACFSPISGIVGGGSPTAFTYPVGGLPARYQPLTSTIIWTVNGFNAGAGESLTLGWDSGTVSFFVARSGSGRTFGAGLGGITNIACQSYIITPLP
jgi:hypothetical protein